MVEKTKETGLLMGTEVANATHVNALEYDIDVLWIGARTTVNLRYARIGGCFTRD
jgi:chorismate mutase